jgi:hypothetical protein
MRTNFKILTLLAFLSCSTKETKTVGDTTSQANQTDNEIKLKEDTLLLANVVTHYFSSPIIKDTFRIKLTGQTVDKGTVEFEIKTSSGLIIHYEKYPSYYLIGYGLESYASEEEKTQYIRDRVLTFFSEENFRQPAIAKDVQFDGDYSDKEIWDDIKSDSTAVKFEYLIAEESQAQIVYSKRLKKVVTIFSCC